MIASRSEQLLRFGFAAVLVAALFAVRWDFSLDHFDFRAWRAAELLLDGGKNPYDSSLLNAATSPVPGELTSDPHNVELHLFNPPTWITQLRLMGVSAFVMSLSGACALFASLVVLARHATRREVAAYLVSAWVFLYLGPGVDTFRFGQTGLFLAGLVGLRLLVLGSTITGLPVAMLSFKPHLAFASGIGEVFVRPRRLLLALAGSLAALIGLQLIQDGVDPWLWWTQSLREERTFGTLTDMSVRTLSPHLPWNATIGALWLGAGVVAVTLGALRWRAADAKLVSLAGLATIAYFSGHAFSHDWLWLPLVPAVCRWRPMTALLTAVGFSAIHTLAFSLRIEDAPIQPKSLLGIGTVLFLAESTRRSAARQGIPHVSSLPIGERNEPREVIEAA